MGRVLALLPLLAAIASGAPSAAVAAPLLVAQSAAAQQIRTIVVSEPTVEGRRIATDPAGLLQVLFSDGSALTLGPGSEMVIDSYRHDRSAGAARLSATLRRGVFRFAGGLAAKAPEGVRLNTPFGRLDLKNAGGDIDLGGEGRAPHADLVFGDEMVLTSDGGRERVYKTGYSLVFDAAGGASIRKTERDWRRSVQTLLSGRPGPLPRHTSAAGQAASATGRAG